MQYEVGCDKNEHMFMVSNNYYSDYMVFMSYLRSIEYIYI